ncbi:hypothetical protein KQI30_07910 [Clostridium bornimense]|uniref:hypothetical protein n=1 Tax=Clostridium bornimense TaxID=1216932 RepID=UPI001C10F5DD|nr:hypothetical protein [Clostridium bornimense]MBU5316195.1 hypothetical protein [Clostridium bornimense]
MNFDKDELLIKDALNSIETPGYKIDINIRKETNRYKGTRRCIALAIALTMFVSVGGMGATIPSFNRLISKVQDEIGNYLYPIQLTSEDKGIKTEVVAAYNDDDMAVIYINIQDLEGNRVDGSTDFYNYSFSNGDTFGAELVNYDESTKTATMRVMINGGKKLSNKDIVFTLNSFISGGVELEDIDTGINISDFYTEEQKFCTLKEETSSGSGGADYKKLYRNGIEKILPLEDKNIAVPGVDFMHITNMGVIDGEFHIQTKWTGTGIDDHGFFFINDENGEEVPYRSVYFGISKEGRLLQSDDRDNMGNYINGYECQEFIYDLKSIDINKSKITAYMKSSKNYIEGNWKTKFKLKAIDEKKEYKCNIEEDNIKINKMILTPLGLTMYGQETYQYDNVPKMEVVLNMKNGTVKKLDSEMWDDEKGILLKCVGDEIIKVDEVQSISINGKTIE